MAGFSIDKETKMEAFVGALVASALIGIFSANAIKKIWGVKQTFGAPTPGWWDLSILAFLTFGGIGKVAETGPAIGILYFLILTPIFFWLSIREEIARRKIKG